MVRKILMTKEQECVWTYFLENGEIVEIHCSPVAQNNETAKALGNIYIGKVQNIAANIGAAFIDVGGVNCYYDLSQAPQAYFTNKIGKKPLCISDELLVQISREAVKTKAPTVTSNISLTGRYAVLTTGNHRIGVSSKIPKAEREELKQSLSGLQNKEFGIIVRTNARDASHEEILQEIELLKAKYRHLVDTAKYRTCYSCLYTASKSYIADLKNVYSEGLAEILVEDAELYEEVREYFETEQPEYLEILRKYDDPLLPLSGFYNTHSVLKKALGEKVWLKTGGYLVIQPTEALTVIDVNSGKCVSKKKTADTYYKINLEAAEEIGKQLRLRNLSGIIVVDFINLDDEEKMHELLKEFRKVLAQDPLQTTLVDVTGLQLVEITRKKIRKPLYECCAFLREINRSEREQRQHLPEDEDE